MWGTAAWCLPESGVQAASCPARCPAALCLPLLLRQTPGRGMEQKGLGRCSSGVASELQFLEFIWDIEKAVVLLMSIQ